MRKIKHLSCHWVSRSLCRLRTSDSFFWHIHTAVSTHFLLGFFSPPQFFLKKYPIFLQSFVAKTFACPLAVFIFDNLPSKPRPTVAIFAKSIINALPPPRSLPSHHLTRYLLLYLYHTRYLLLYLSTRSASEFLRICSFTSFCLSVHLLSSGFAFIRRIPRPPWPFIQSISPARHSFLEKPQTTTPQDLASLVICSTYINLFIQQVPEGRGFSSAPCAELAT